MSISMMTKGRIVVFATSKPQNVSVSIPAANQNIAEPLELYADWNPGEDALMRDLVKDLSSDYDYFPGCYEG